MNKTKIIPFDLLRWTKKDFKRVMTRECEIVNNLTQFNVDREQPLYGQVGQDVMTWKLCGGWEHKKSIHKFDLMLEVEEKVLEGWVNVYKNRFGKEVFNSLEEAKVGIYDKAEFITTIQITYNDNN